MRLIAKIFPHYFKQILEGEKKEEFRQMEEIVFVNAKTGEEIIFRIKGISKTNNLEELRKQYPDVPWKEDLVTVKIELGEMVGSILKPKVIKK
jgi:hypothetical protein